MASKQLRAAAKLEYYRRDFRAFGREQLRIKGIVPGELLHFEMDTGQQRLYAIWEKQRQEKGYIRGVTLKGRQSGWSTLSQGVLFQSTSLTPNYNSLLLANDQASSSRIFDMAHLFWEEMDEDIRPMCRYSTKQELVFANPDKRQSARFPGLRSRMDFQHAGNIMAGTGSTRQALHLSEAAKWESRDIDLLVSSLLPTIHPVPGTIVIMESTAFVGGEYFREMCERARSGRSNWSWCFSPWWLNNRNRIALQPGEKFVPNSDEKSLIRLAARGQKSDDVPAHEMQPEQLKWYRERLDEFGDLFEQEYPRDFASAWVNRDLNVFDRSIMHDMEQDVREVSQFVDIMPGPRVNTVKFGGRPFLDENYVAVWEEPIDGVVYDIGIDVGQGLDNGDWSVAEVFRRDTGEQVAEYHKHIDPVDLAGEIYWLGKWYKNAQLVVEMNNVGYITGNHLALLSYPYIYIWRHRERSVPTLSTYAGFKTTWESKKLLVGNGRHKFIHRNIKVRSRVLHDEMSQFVRIDADQYRAAQGNDDAVMAMLLALQGGIDESWGVPKAVPREERERTIYNPALRDNTDFGARKDRIADAIIKDLRGVA